MPFTLLKKINFVHIIGNEAKPTYVKKNVIHGNLMRPDMLCTILFTWNDATASNFHE